MTRLIALLALLLAAYAPAAARAMPAMSCCPQEMAAMKGHHGSGHGDHDRILPGDAADCAVPAATPAAPAALLPEPPARFALLSTAPVERLTDRAPSAELPPPRSAA